MLKVPSSLIGSIPHLGKFGAHCLQVCEKVTPYFAVGAATAPATGGLSLVAALGAAGVAIADLYLDLKNNKGQLELQEQIASLRQLIDSQSGLLSTTHANLTKLRQLVDEHHDPSDPTLADTHRPLLHLVHQDNTLAPAISELLSELLESQLHQSTENTEAILRQNEQQHEALLQLISDQQHLPAGVFKELASISDEIRSDLAQIQQSLQSLHGKVDNIEDQLSQIQNQLANLSKNRDSRHLDGLWKKSITS